MPAPYPYGFSPSMGTMMGGTAPPPGMGGYGGGMTGGPPGIPPFSPFGSAASPVPAGMRALGIPGVPGAATGAPGMPSGPVAGPPPGAAASLASLQQQMAAGPPAGAAAALAPLEQRMAAGPPAGGPAAASQLIGMLGPGGGMPANMAALKASLAGMPGGGAMMMPPPGSAGPGVPGQPPSPPPFMGSGTGPVLGGGDQGMGAGRLNPAQQMLADSGRRRIITDMLARQGQFGDNMMARINPGQANALRMAGGVGTRNPVTGLPQFYRGRPTREDILADLGAVPDLARVNPDIPSDANIDLTPLGGYDDLASQGRGGDTMLAHVNPSEVNVLRRMGGSGGVNPRTGLREFQGADEGGPAGPDSVDHESGAAATAGDGGGFGGGGADPTGGADPDRGMRGPLGEGGLPVHTGAEGPAGSPTGTPGGASKYGGVGSALESAKAGYADRYRGEGWAERNILDPIGEAFGRLFGVETVPPDINRPATYAGGTYHTGLNVPGLAGGILGTALGVPGLGFGAGQLANKLGIGDVILGGGSAPGFGGAPAMASAPGGATTGPTATAGPGTGGILNTGVTAADIGNAIGGLFGGGGTTAPIGRAGGLAPGQGVSRMGERGGSDRQRAYALARLGMLLGPYGNA